jgi:hypothetical protein
MAGAVLVPLGFGLVPAFLSKRVPIAVRWCLWLILLAASAIFVTATSGTPQPFAFLALASFCLSTSLSFWILMVETMRSGRVSQRQSGRV